MCALALLALIPVALWLAQTVLLRVAGLPVQWQLSSRALPRGLKRINRTAGYVAIAAALLAYPLVRGLPPLGYYAAFFPAGRRPVELAHGFCAALLYLSLLYLAWTVSGNVRFEIRHDARRLLRRVAAAPLAAVAIALVEELLFRAMLLNDLLVSMRPGPALATGVFVFAAAHYTRGVKRYWTFFGHLALGTLFCVAFYCTRALWLPLGLHAAGILILSAARPFIRYTGPAWLVGASIFPYAGAVGIVALLALVLNVALSYGGLP